MFEVNSTQLSKCTYYFLLLPNLSLGFYLSTYLSFTPMLRLLFLCVYFYVSDCNQCCCDAYCLYVHIHGSSSEPVFCVRVLPVILASFKNIEKPYLLKLWMLANVHKHDSAYLSYSTHPKCACSLLTGFQNGWTKMSPSTPPQSKS